MRVSKLTLITIALCAVVIIGANTNAGNNAQSQDVRILDRRITLLEQRLNSIEVSINRLEQSAYSQRSAAPPTTIRDPETSLIREEIQSLRLRVTEVECGLLKLDERTTTSGGGTRKGSGTRPTDPCRVNPMAPVRLSARP